jgi:hypothetical protein
MTTTTPNALTPSPLTKNENKKYEKYGKERIRKKESIEKQKQDVTNVKERTRKKDPRKEPGKSPQNWSSINSTPNRVHRAIYHHLLRVR